MTTPNDRSERRPLSEAQIEQRREAGRRGGAALVKEYGSAHMAELGTKGHEGKGKGGGRPTFEQWLAKARAREAAIQARRPRPGRKKKEAL